MIMFQDYFILIQAIFFISFLAYLMGSLADFFPRFFASLTSKYKNKTNYDIDHNRDYNQDNDSIILKYLNKIPNKSYEVKKNHGKRIPFFKR